MKEILPRILLTFLLLLAYVSLTNAQSALIFSRYEPESNSLSIRWYSETIIDEEGYNIYRMESGSWKKLNDEALKPENQFSYSSIENESTRDLCKALLENGPIEDKNSMEYFFLLQLLLKNDTVARYIGIEFVDENVVINDSYQYRITAIRGRKEIELGILNNAIASVEGYPKPQQVIWEGTNKKIKIGWKDEPATYYGVNVYRRLPDSNAKGEKVNEEPILISGTRSPFLSRKVYYHFEDVLSKTGETYEYVLVAVDYFGKEAGSAAPVTAQTMDVEPPYSPDSILFEIDHASLSVNFTWNQRNPNDVDGFNIVSARDRHLPFEVVKGRIAGEQRMADIVYENEGYHYAAIQAYDTAGNIATSDTLVIFIEDKKGPAQPKSFQLKFDSSEHKVILSWNHVTDVDLDGYVVFRYTDNVDSSNIERLVANPLVDTVFEDVIPKNRVGKLYYRINAVDTSNNYGNPTPILVHSFPDKNPPPAPFLTDLKFEEEAVNIAWQPVACTDLDYYTLYARSSDTARFEQVNLISIDKNSLNFLHRNPTPSAKMQYVLLATDTAGNVSDTSNLKIFHVPAYGDEVSFTALDLKAKRNDDKLSLKWQVDKPENTLAFVVYSLQPNTNTWLPISGKLQESSFELDKLPDGEYQFEIRAYTKTGKKVKSEIKTHQVITKKK